MAAPPPVKSQSLHNFSLPRLKWAHKSSSSSASASASSSHQHRLRRRDSPDQRHHHKSSSSTDPGNPSQQSPPDSPRNDGVQGEEDENGEGKPWNLRPRKEATRAAAAAAKKNYKKGDGSCNVVKSQRLRGMVEGGQINGGAERKGKRKIWISLSREEIEEDIYALTGGKPSRRPRKWPKNVQKQMDNVFPGSYLAGVSADSYRAMMPWRSDADMEVIEQSWFELFCKWYLGRGIVMSNEFVISKKA